MKRLCWNCAVKTQFASCTLLPRQIFARAHLVRRDSLGSKLIYRFLHRFGSLVPISARCSRQKGRRTIYRSPPGCLQIMSGKNNRVYTNVQSEGVPLNEVRGLMGKGVRTIVAENVSSLFQKIYKRPKRSFTTSLAEGKRISELFWTQSLSHHQPHRRCILAKNVITATEISLAVKTCYTAGCD